LRISAFYCGHGDRQDRHIRDQLYVFEGAILSQIAERKTPRIRRGVLQELKNCRLVTVICYSERQTVILHASWLMASVG
jgi:hypothetical protein